MSEIGSKSDLELSVDCLFGGGVKTIKAILCEIAEIKARLDAIEGKSSATQTQGDGRRTDGTM